MPQLRPDSSLAEYLFTEQETIAAKILSPLQVMWLQTQYTLLMKKKASSLVPESGELDRSFFLQMGEIEGHLNCIQQMFNDSLEAQSLLAQRNLVTEPISNNDISITALSDRASAQVNVENS